MVRHDQGRPFALGAGQWLADDRRPPSLTKPSRPAEAIVRLVLKGTVVHLEIKKPAGKWEKVSSVAYSKLEPDAETGMPIGLGLNTITGFSALIEDNKNRAVFR